QHRKLALFVFDRVVLLVALVDGVDAVGGGTAALAGGDALAEVLDLRTGRAHAIDDINRRTAGSASACRLAEGAKDAADEADRRVAAQAGGRREIRLSDRARFDQDLIKNVQGALVQRQVRVEVAEQPPRHQVHRAGSGDK